MARSETAQAIVEELETRVRIAERQGWTNRNVPVQLLRQAAEELRDLLALVGAHPQGKTAEQIEQDDPIWKLCGRIDGELTGELSGSEVADSVHWLTAEIRGHVRKRLALVGAETPPRKQESSEPPQHVCGLEGYNGMIDPPCPACERANLYRTQDAAYPKSRHRQCDKCGAFLQCACRVGQ